MRSLSAFALLAWLTTCGTPLLARAQSASLTVVGDEELAAATRLQFLGERAVRSGTWPDGRTGIAAASEVRNVSASDLVAWVETGSSANEAVLFVLGPAPGRAVLQVLHLQYPAGPDRTRALAIKLREVVDALHPAASEEAATNVLGEEVRETSDVRPVAAARVEVWTPGMDAPIRMEVGLRAGVRLAWFEATVGIAFGPSVTLRAEPSGQIDSTTLSPLVNIAVVFPAGRFRLGGSLEFRLRTLVFSGGVPPDSRTESTVSPGVSGLLNGDILILPRLFLRLSPGLTWFPIQEHVRLGGPRLVSLPRFSGVFNAEIIWEF